MKKKFWYIAIVVFTVGVYLIDYIAISNYKPELGSHLISLTDSELNHKLQSDGETLCVLYYTEESLYSQKMEDAMSQMKSGKYNDLPIYKINIDEYPRLSYERNLAGVPMVVVYKEGKEKTRIMGSVSVANIDMILKRITK